MPTRDAAGRLTAVTAGDLVQEWAYRNGYLSEHTRTNRAEANGGTDITLIGRDEDGRITGLTRAGAVARYGYDGAGQLVAAATTPLGKTGAAATARAQVSEWENDAGGRLVREYTPAGPRTYTYDTAGQLLSVTEADGSRTEYVYDGLGRRSRRIGADGSWSEYAWGETGYLQGTVDRTPDGAETARHELWVDALGELASVDSCPTQSAIRFAVSSMGRASTAAGTIANAENYGFNAEGEKPSEDTRRRLHNRHDFGYEPCYRRL